MFYVLRKAEFLLWHVCVYPPYRTVEKPVLEIKIVDLTSPFAFSVHHAMNAVKNRTHTHTTA
jgi:hypothetical protein